MRSKRSRSKRSQKAMWALVGASAGLAAGVIADRAVDAGWRAMKDEDPPTDAGLAGVSWPTAILFTAASATAVGLAQLAARRGAAVGWKKATGRKPPRLS